MLGDDRASFVRHVDLPRDPVDVSGGVRPIDNGKTSGARRTRAARVEEGERFIGRGGHDLTSQLPTLSIDGEDRYMATVIHGHRQESCIGIGSRRMKRILLGTVALVVLAASAADLAARLSRAKRFLHRYQ